MSDIDKLIAEVEQLDREATPGPWLHYKRANTKPNEWPAWALADVEDEEEQRIAAEGEPADIALIAHYRTAAPALAAEVRRLRAELARRDALDAAWNAGAAEARGRVLHNLAADPRDHMPPEFRADEEIAAAWLAGWAADAAIVRLAEIERERDEARGVEVHGGDFEDEAMVERAAEQEAGSAEPSDEYDYTRCICLDGVSRWCPTCGEEHAERRAADKAPKAGSPS